MVQTGRNRVADLVIAQRETLLRDWVQAVMRRTTTSRRSVAELESTLAPMLDALIAGLHGDALDANAPAFDELRALLAEFSRDRARQGFTPSETAVAVFAFKDAVLSALEQDRTAYLDFPPFSRFVDDLGLVTFETFALARESVIAAQSEQLLELSTPVVKLWEGIVAVPIVGTLDSARTQLVMESLLQTLVSTGSSQAIIDITGVAAVDTQVAQHLLKTVVAARLMGADCIISGMRPQIAQTIVALGVEFGDIVTKASLADALRLALKDSGLEVRKSERPR